MEPRGSVLDVIIKDIRGAMKPISDLLDQVSNKKLLVIFPHPDDETVMSAGLIQRAIREGWKVGVVCLTKGERGKIHINGNGLSLSQIRNNEFREALQILGVNNPKMYDFGDGSLRESKKWQKHLRELICKIDPGIIVTYDHSGVTGHPDHIAVSLEVKKIVSTCKLKTLVISPTFRGMPAGKIVNPAVAKYLLPTKWVLPLSLGEIIGKWRAIKAYRSQKLGKNLPLPILIIGMIFRHEYFAHMDVTKQYSYKYVDFDLGD